MKFAINHHGSDPVRDRVIDAVAAEFTRRGHKVAPLGPDTRFVLNGAQTRAPEPFHRHAQALFVASFATIDGVEADFRSRSYATLVRTLSNVMVTIVPKDGSDEPEVYFTTPEAGFYHYRFEAGRICDSLQPIVSARLMIHNRLSADLPKHLWETSPVVEQIRSYAREMDRLGVLPTPFPLRDVLPPAEIEHLYQTFEMTGLSYGNLSAREDVPELGRATFWMSARGVDKARLSTVGRDILLVTGYDEEAGDMLISVPPDHDTRARASVDAVEHCLIYDAFPQVRAIVHVHAWLDGVSVTHQNHPCGTIEIARAVAEMVSRAPDPARAEIGLKNHGLTITGTDLGEIFDRIGSRLRTEVPMAD